MRSLRSRLLRLAHANPGPVREALLPLLREANTAILPAKVFTKDPHTGWTTTLGQANLGKAPTKLFVRDGRTTIEYVVRPGWGGDEMWEYKPTSPLAHAPVRIFASSE